MSWRTGEPCSLTLDVGLGEAVAEGDWVATEAGARHHRAKTAAEATERARRRAVS